MSSIFIFVFHFFLFSNPTLKRIIYAMCNFINQFNAFGIMHS